MKNIFTLLLVLCSPFLSVNAQEKNISDQVVASAKKIAYVTQPSSSTYALDTVILPRLMKNPDFAVTEVDGTTTISASDYDNFDMILISEVLQSGAAGNGFLKGINKPVLNMKVHIYKTAAPGWSWTSGYGQDPTENTIVVADKTHPIFNGVTFTGAGNNEVGLLSSVLSSKGLTWVFPSEITVSGGAIVSLASMKSAPAKFSIIEIPVGTTVTDTISTGTVTLNKKFIQIGISSSSDQYVTADAYKIIENACYYLLSPVGNILVTGITVSGAGGATTITTSGGTLQMNAAVEPTNATNKSVTWSVDNTALATISASGLLTALGNGTVTVTATANDGSGVKGTLTVVISNQTPVVLVTGIVVGGGTAIATKSGTLQMTATVLPANATNKTVTWSVDNTSLATISASGLLTAIANGMVTVTATANDASGITGTAMVTISGQVVADVKKIAYVTDPAAATYALDTVILPRLRKNPDFAVTEVNGTTTISASDYDNFDMILISEVIQSGAAGNGFLKGINKPVLNMKVHIYKTSVWNWTMGYGQDPTENTIVVANKTHPIFNGVTFTGTSNNEVVLLSSVFSSKGLTWVFPSEITVSGGAIVSLASMKSAPAKFSIIEIPVGTTVTDSTGGATVTINQKWLQIGISSASDQNVTADAYKIIENACYYLLPPIGNTPVTGITVNGTGGATTITTSGGTLQMNAAIAPTNATNKSVTWSVDNTGLATINASGLLTAVANGTVTVTATANDGFGVKGSLPVVISNQAPVVLVTSITIDGGTAIATKSGTLQMTATVLPANATNKTVTWSVDKTDIGSISNAGLLTAIANGKVVVRATAYDGSGIFGVDTVTISGQIPLITTITVTGEGNATTITTKGATLQMSATIVQVNGNNNTVTWSVDKSTVANINAISGLLTAVSDGVVIVTATANDGSGVIGTLAITISGQSVGVQNIDNVHLTYYLNSAQDVLSIVNAVSQWIEIINIQGQVLISEKNSSDNVQINVSNLKPGLYMIRSGSSIKKFVKK